MNSVTSVSFDWSHPSAINFVYTISINGGVASAPQSTNLLSHTENGLNGGDEVELTIYAEGINSCGDSEPISIICTAQDCPLVEPEVMGLASSYCSNAEDVLLSADPAGGIFTGIGVLSDGWFSPSTANVGSIVITYTFTDQNGCVQSTNINTVVMETLEETKVRTICEGDSVFLEGGFQVLPGIYKDTMNSLNGCDSVIFTELYLFKRDTAFQFFTTCDPQEVGVEVERFLNSNGCDSLVLTEMIFDPVEINTTAEVLTEVNGYAISCNGEEDGAISVVSTTGGNGPYNYLWSTGENGELIENLNAGWTYFTVTDTDGCGQVDSFFLQEPEPLNTNTVATPPLCHDDLLGSIEILNTTGGVGQYLYSLDGGPFAEFSEISGVSIGQHNLIVQDINGCEIEEVISIESPDLFEISLGLDTTLALGDSLFLEILTNVSASAIDSIFWETNLGSLDCPNCMSTWVKPFETTAVRVLLYDENGCAFSDEIELKLKKYNEVYIPSGFSPNGDGNNDLFMIYAGGEVGKINSFQVYDRWGEAVFRQDDFQPNDINFAWDGSFRGEILNPAVFVYFVEVEFIDGHTELFKGDVTLVK